MPLRSRPAVLIVLDGYGIAPPNPTNAVWVAQTPFFDSLTQNYPTMLLEASGLNVGLPRTEVGNSEVGHLNIGSGILMYQSLPKINQEISTGRFFKHKMLDEIIEKVKQRGSKLHLVGLLGNGGVHASQDHLEALITWTKKHKIWKQTFIHGFLDGRDTGKDTGIKFLELLYKYAKKPKIASLSGRFFAMDRNSNWDRIEKAYNAIINGTSEKTHDNPKKALKEAYKAEMFDEEFEPMVIMEKGKPLATVEEGDVVLCFNFRADRMRQLGKALSVDEFDSFDRGPRKNIDVYTFTEYEKDLPVNTLYPTEIIQNPLAKIFSDLNLAQLHIAETEKYAHVTFFLNGRKEEAFPGEERILIPSPSVANYAESPEMSALKVTDEIIKAVQSGKHDFIAINYANADMVGHTGDLNATVSAIQTVDQCLARIVPEIVRQGGICFIVADHGNAEEMINLATGQVDKEHNIYPVPFVIVERNLAGYKNLGENANDLSFVPPIGILSDIAPTILHTIGINPPPEMTGRNLL